MATLLSILLEPVFSLVDLLWRGHIFHNFLFHRSVLETFSVWYDILPSQRWGWVDRGNIAPTGHVDKIIAQTCMQYLSQAKKHLCLPPWFTNVWYEWCKSRTVPWFHFPGSLSHQAAHPVHHQWCPFSTTPSGAGACSFCTPSHFHNCCSTINSLPDI